MNKSIKGNQNIYKQSVFCTLSFDGIHAWYNCPIEEVNFLKVEHRHTFNVKAFYEVNHGDRDQEFIMLKRDIQDYLYDKYYDKDKRTHFLGPKSCEMLCIELIEKFDLYKCIVDEDGENGGIVEVLR